MSIWCAGPKRRKKKKKEKKTYCDLVALDGVHRWLTLLLDQPWHEFVDLRVIIQFVDLFQYPKIFFFVRSFDRLTRVEYIFQFYNVWQIFLKRDDPRQNVQRRGWKK